MNEAPMQVCMEDKAVLLLPTIDLVFFVGALS